MATVDPGEGRRRALDALDLVITVGVAVAVVIFIAVAGWLLDLVRFAAAGLPAATAAGLLKDRQLLTDGFSAMLLMLGVFAVGCALAYFSSARRWDVHGQDWHDIVRKGGVRNAAADPTAVPERELRERRHARRQAADAERFADWARHRRLTLLARPAARLAAKASQPLDPATPHEPAASLDPANLNNPTDAPLNPAPLGDWAVRLIAGFNIGILAALVAVTVARGVESALPAGDWWVGALAGAAVFLILRWLLTRVSPLVIDARLHALVWVLVAVFAILTSAPVGVLTLTGVLLSTAGRALGRLQRPRSFRAAIRSPLLWVLLTITVLLAVSFEATGPVGFPTATVPTHAGQTVGGYLTHNAAGVDLVTCTALADATSADVKLTAIPRTSITGPVRIGGDDYVDSGARPSLAALALAALGIQGSPPNLFPLDLRARRPTCAGTLPTDLSAGHYDPALGSGVIVGPAPPGGRARDGEPPIEQTSPAAIATLAKRYQPTLLVTVADRNWPVSVGAVLAELGPTGRPACLVRPSAQTPTSSTNPTNSTNPTTPTTPATTSTTPTNPATPTPTSTSTSTPHQDCPATLADLSTPGAATSDYLQLPVTLASNRSPNGQFHAFLRGQSSDIASQDTWLEDPARLDPWQTAQIYFYYAGPIDTSQYPPKAQNPNVPSGLIGLEYWFYYPFNYYPLLVNSSLMNGAPLAGDEFNVDLHQGDWEHVDVLLNPQTLQPEWLYMARHSYEGQFVPWNSPSLTFDHRSHVVLQAAFGGHPTYLPGCGAQPRTAADDYLDDWLVCGSGRFAFTATTTPLVDLAKTSWACWPGHFGEARNQIELQAAGQPESTIDSIEHQVYVAGPLSPLTQAENLGVCSRNPDAAEQSADTQG